MSNFDNNGRNRDGSGEGSSSGGATGVFGTVPEQTGSPSPFAEDPSAAPVTPMVPSSGDVQKTPNVHEVVFHAPGSGMPGHTDSLKRILESSPPPAKAPEAALPSTPAGGAGFTQLLRALSPADLAAAAPKPAPVFSPAPEPQAFQPAAAVPPAPAAPSAPSSFDQVFAGIGSVPAKSAPVAESVPPVASQGSSFTQMFAAISSPAVGEPKPAASITPDTQATQAFASPVASPTPAQTGGGFTQMFSALDPQGLAAPQSTSPPALAAKAAPPSTGGFTQMFQALDPKAAVPAKVGEEAQIYRPAPEAPTAPATPQSVLAAGGGFTQMFEALDPAPKAAPAVIPVPPSASVGSTAPASAPASGGITQLLKAFDAGAAAPSPSAPFPAIPAVKVDLHESVPEPASLTVAPKSAAAADPGSFTQVFQAAPTFPKSASALPTPPVSSSPSASSGGGGGSFTQLFSTLDKGYSPAAAANQMPENVDPFARNASPVARGNSVTPPASSGMGSSPGGNPGSFTQIFSASSMQPKGPTSQADYFPPASAGSQTPGTFNPDGMPGFGNQQAPAGGGFGASPVQSFSSPSPTPPAGGPSGGGLTQLLRTLDAPGASLTSTKVPEAANAFTGSGAPPPAYGAAPMTPAVTGPASAPQSLTQQFSAMNASPQASAPTPFGSPGAPPPAGVTGAFKMPSAPQGPAAPPPQAGPGEYTRIIQASQFRENAAQGGQPNAMPSAGGAPAAGGGGGGMKSPVRFTPGSVSMPQMGSASIGGGSLGGGSLGGGSMGGGSMGGMHMGGMSSPSMGVPGVGMPHVGLPSARIPSAQLQIPPIGGAPKAPAAPGTAPKSSMTMIIVIIALVLVVAILLAVLLLRK